MVLILLLPMPALLIKMCTSFSVLLMSSTNLRTDLNDDKSKCLLTMLLLPVRSIMRFLVCSESSLSAIITRQPLEASDKAVS